MKRIVTGLCVSAFAGMLLSGCSASFSPADTFEPQQTPIGPIQGNVHGGQQAVTGAAVYLYAAGTAGYGSASTSLIKTTSPLPSGVSVDGNGNGYVTTDVNGNFTLSGDYTCTEGQQVYMVAVGGNPGLTGTVNNTYIVQMAGLGECPSTDTLASQDPYVTLNEVSTVAFAYAMAPFEGADEYHIGTNGTTAGKLAIHNAMANVGKMVSLQYGQAYSSVPGNTNAAVPLAKIYHLANLLATCVNTNGTLGTSKFNAAKGTYTYTLSGCGSLFNDSNGVTEANGNITTTSDEAQAIFYIAQNPSTANVTKLYNLVTGATAFADSLATAPTDWTLPIVYSSSVSVFAQTNGSNTNGPFNIAIDGSGNAWIGDRIKGVVEISTLGTVSTWNSGFGMIKQVAIAPSGNLWVADYNSSKVYIMNTAGTVLKTLTTGFDGPAGIAFNNAGNAYIVNELNASVTVYDPTGTTVLNNQTSFTNVGNGITTPDFVSIDANGNAWIPDTGGGTLGELTTTYTTGYINNNSVGQAYWLGFDSSSNLWIGDMGNGRLGTGTPNGSGSYTIGHKTASASSGVSNPDLGEIDGSGTVWMPDMIVPPTNNPPSTAASVLSAYSQTTGGFLATANNGFSTGGIGGAVAAAVDLSGNVWVANEDGSVSELIGLGTPTASPLTPSNAGTKP
jgi:hypothetical protein